MIKKIKYGNSVIQYELIKSKRRKKSQITVTSDGVTVRTPQTKTTNDVRNMIQQRLQWIFKKQLHFAKQKKSIFSIKSSLTILDKDYKIQIITNSAEKTRLIDNTIEFHIPQTRYTTKQTQAQHQPYHQNSANDIFPNSVKN